jgi:8-oxo-dGTP pyrophosphatase MutT (NUDIX family)
MNQMRPRTEIEVSAGGLVLSQSDPGKVALISHRNRGGGEDWVIPKGHQEPGEDLKTTAIREVAEETGINAEVIRKIGEITYSFRLGHKRIRKTVHHYLLRQVSGSLVSDNDPAGEVIAVGWFPLSELDSILAHENERKVASQALEMLE